MHSDMGHGDMGHGDMDMGGKCNMNVRYSLWSALIHANIECVNRRCSSPGPPRICASFSAAGISPDPSPSFSPSSLSLSLLRAMREYDQRPGNTRLPMHSGSVRS